MGSNHLIIAGFMSGTSMDGLDCCIAEINIDADWKFQYNIIANQSFAFNQNKVTQLPIKKSKLIMTKRYINFLCYCNSWSDYTSF